MIHMLPNDVKFGLGQICIVSVHHPFAPELYDVSNNFFRCTTFVMHILVCFKQ